MMIGTTLGHYRIVEQTGRHSAPSRAKPRDLTLRAIGSSDW